MKLDRILVAMDFGAPSLAAAQWAVEQLAPDAEFVLCHTITLPAPPGFLRGVLPDSDSTIDLLRTEGEARLRELAATLPTERITTELVVGRPAEEIARAAERMGADLILLGPHGRRYTEWDAIGSTAEAVVRDSAVPAFVARALPAGGVERVLASVDESSVTDDVLAWAAFLSRKLDAQLAVVHVLDSGLWGAARSARSPDEMDNLEQTAESTTRKWLTERLEAAGLDAAEVEAIVAFGDPKYEIVTAAKKVGADLLVVGSRDRAGVSAAHLGAVAASVLRGSDTPVFVVTGPNAGGAASEPPGEHDAE